LRTTAFINQALATTASIERRALLELHPALDKAKDTMGGFLSGRKKTVGQVLEPLKKAYEREISN